MVWTELKARFPGSLANAGRYISRGSCDCMMCMVRCTTEGDELIVRICVCVCMISPLWALLIGFDFAWLSGLSLRGFCANWFKALAEAACPAD